MTTATFDRDNLRSTAQKLRELADDYESRVLASADAVVTKAREEASVNTRDGKPAPIYTETLSALQDSVTAVKSKFQKIIDTLRQDAETFDKVAAESAAVEDAAVSDIGTIDTKI